MSLSEIELACKKILSSKNILIFSGAGISTSAGIPDFRSSSGVWRNREPVYFDEFISNEDKRREYWSYKLEMWNYFKNAKPTFSHFLITKLYNNSKIIGVVTQNIDGLHQKAGIPKDLVIELHGNNHLAVCMSCGNKVEFEKAISYFSSTKEVPRCKCGGILKPDVVMFGEPLDMGLLSRAFEMAKKCDLVISIGSTLVVQPAANVPLKAKLNGCFYMIINKGSTSHDNICDLKIDGYSDDVFKEIDLRIGKNLNQ